MKTCPTCNASVAVLIVSVSTNQRFCHHCSGVCPTLATSLTLKVRDVRFSASAASIPMLAASRMPLNVQVKIPLCRRLTTLVFFVICSITALWAQEATVNRNIILRRDPTTSSPILAHLPRGTRLTLVDAKPDSGFYHVKTEDDRVGWVFGKFVTISQATSPVTTTPQIIGTGTCDASISAHVYHPKRLIVKQECISVTGIIVDATAPQRKKQPDGTRHEPDGDTHGWLKVDPGFENLLNAGNISNEDGNLVFEIICRFPVSQADAKTACQNYTDKVTLPAVGSHVRIVGRFVQDTFHAQWNEIHPVTSIIAVP